MLDARGTPIATVNRAFRGFGREVSFAYSISAFDVVERG
jgi:hypothetical protein